MNALRSAGLEAFSWWTFDMIFEENNPDTTHHLPAGSEFGRGTLGADASWQTVSGVPLPSYRAFQLLRDAGDELVPVSFRAVPSGNSSGTDGTLSIMATRNSSRSHGQSQSNASSRGHVTHSRIFLANFAPDDGQGATPVYNYTRTVELELIGILAGTSTVTLHVINSSCANPKRAWSVHPASSHLLPIFLSEP
eukprot:COSAG01_NODE_988_length_12303_cov_5.060472_9_plen_194_part_00